MVSDNTDTFCNLSPAQFVIEATLSNFPSKVTRSRDRSIDFPSTPQITLVPVKLTVSHQPGDYPSLVRGRSKLVMFASSVCWHLAFWRRAPMSPSCRDECSQQVEFRWTEKPALRALKEATKLRRYPVFCWRLPRPPKLTQPNFNLFQIINFLLVGM